MSNVISLIKKEKEKPYYVCFKNKRNKNVFVVVEEGKFYAIGKYESENKTLEITSMEYLGLCSRVSEGQLKFVGTGFYSESIFKTIEKKEVI